MEQKDKEIEQEYVKNMLGKNLFAVVYPKDKSRESTLKMVDMVDSAVGIAEFEDENTKNIIYGVLIDKIQESKKNIKVKMSNED